MAPCKIYVTGHSVLHRRAERAILNVWISASDHDHEAPSKHVTSTARKLQKLLEPLAPKDDYGLATDDAPVTHFAMSSVATSSQTPHDSQNKPLQEVFKASTTFEIKFKDFDKLGSVAHQLSTMEFVALNGVEWELTSATKESLASHNRREAMRDAVKKASDLADALNMPEFVPVEVKEGQVYQRTGGHGMPLPKKQNVIFKDAPTDDEALQFVPEDVMLNVKVDAQFLVEDPKTIDATQA